MKPNKNKKFSLPLLALFFLLVMPASTNYKLKDYGFGTGGTGSATSGNYALDAIMGEISGGKMSGSNYNAGPGLAFTNQANVPPAPTFSNPGNYYNKLQIILNISGNPSDTKYAIAISTDNFTTTNYVQSDDTIGSTWNSADYQTYTNWGGASGFYVIGLAPNTTYYVKVKAMQGKFTETGYGPVVTTSTVNPTLSFGISTDNEPSPPFSIDFGNLVPNSVNNSPQKIWISLSTNSANGGSVFVSGSNAGLFSTIANHKISAVSGDLSSLNEGFGAQGVSATQTSGGPLTIASLYNQGGNIVGITDQTDRDIFDTSGPISGGSGSFLLMTKPSATAPASNDYAETLTLIASGSF